MSYLEQLHPAKRGRTIPGNHGYDVQIEPGYEGDKKVYYITQTATGLCAFGDVVRCNWNFPHIKLGEHNYVLDLLRCDSCYYINSAVAMNRFATMRGVSVSVDTLNPTFSSIVNTFALPAGGNSSNPVSGSSLTLTVPGDWTLTNGLKGYIVGSSVSTLNTYGTINYTSLGGVGTLELKSFQGSGTYANSGGYLYVEGMPNSVAGTPMTAAYDAPSDTITFTFPLRHSFAVRQNVNVTGLVPAAFNAWYTITGVTSFTATAVLSSIKAATTGTLGTLTTFSGVVYPQTGTTATFTAGSWTLSTVRNAQNSRYAAAVGQQFTLSGCSDPAHNGTFTVTSSSVTNNGSSATVVYNNTATLNPNPNVMPVYSATFTNRPVDSLKISPVYNVAISGNVGGVCTSGNFAETYGTKFGQSVGTQNFESAKRIAVLPSSAVVQDWAGGTINIAPYAFPNRKVVTYYKETDNSLNGLFPINQDSLNLTLTLDDNPFLPGICQSGNVHVDPACFDPARADTQNNYTYADMGLSSLTGMLSVPGASPLYVDRVWHFVVRPNPNVPSHKNNLVVS